MVITEGGLRRLQPPAVKTPSQELQVHMQMWTGDHTHFLRTKPQMSNVMRYCIMEILFGLHSLFLLPCKTHAQIQNLESKTSCQVNYSGIVVLNNIRRVKLAGCGDEVTLS